MARRNSIRAALDWHWSRVPARDNPSSSRWKYTMPAYGCQGLTARPTPVYWKDCLVDTYARLIRIRGTAGSSTFCIFRGSRHNPAFPKPEGQVMTNVAINGLGRIGRATLKIVMETPDLNLVAANDIGSSDSVEYLLKYDTVYGRYEKPVEATDGHLRIGDHQLRLLRERDPARLPWKSMNVEIVFECTGAFTRREDLDAHIRAGAAVRHPVRTFEG